MAELWGRAGGANRKIKKLYANVGGVNREIKQLWAKQDGVNRKIFQNAVTWTRSWESYDGYNSNPTNWQSIVFYDDVFMMKVESNDYEGPSNGVRGYIVYSFQDLLLLPAGTVIKLKTDLSTWKDDEDKYDYCMFGLYYSKPVYYNKYAIFPEFGMSHTAPIQNKTYTVSSDITVSNLYCYFYTRYSAVEGSPNTAYMHVDIQRPGENSFDLNNSGTSDQ